MNLVISGNKCVTNTLIANSVQYERNKVHTVKQAFND